MNYDGFDLNDHVIITDIRRPLLPPQDVRDKKIFGMSGAYFLVKQHEPINIPVDIAFHEDSDLSYRERTRFIAKKLNKREPKRIIFNDEPDVYINGIIRDDTDIETLVKTGETTLNFYCPDPYYYCLNEEAFTFSSEGRHNFTRVQGNEQSLPLIEIRGSNSYGEITIEINDSKITFNGNLTSGETLVLDSNFITSYILKSNGEKDSANQYIDSMDFPILNPDSNFIDVSTSGNASITEIVVNANSRSI